MIIHYEATIDLQGQGNSKERNFEFPSLSNCSIREVHINERFPESAYAKNSICNLAIRVMKGYMTLFIHDEEQTVTFKKGESFEIPKNTAYYIVAEPSVVLFIVSEPIWSEEQLKIVTF
jgi:uncharacterized protein YaiE (UPF0345 family)